MNQIATPAEARHSANREDERRRKRDATANSIEVYQIEDHHEDALCGRCGIITRRVYKNVRTYEERIACSAEHAMKPGAFYDE